MRTDLMAVACGRRSADLYIENGRVLNVHSGEILSGVGVAVASGRVAYVGPSRGMIGPETQFLDAEGGILVPGYVDPHAHFDNILSPRRLAEALLPLGTTMVVNDTLAVVARFGAPGLACLRAAATSLPLHFGWTVPISGWAPELEEAGYFAGLGLTDAELDVLLADETVLGTSEFLPWRRLLAGDQRLIARLDIARRHGKCCEGHNPGARADHLQVIAAAGLTDCHEALTSAEALNRLRAGLYVVLRHGPARYDLPELASLVMKEGVDRSRLMLTPDWVPPNDLAAFGHMDHPLSAAMEAGIPPLDAYRMASLNPARYFRIEGQIGSIAPGRYADILCLNDLREPRPKWVMAQGAVVARNGVPTPDWHGLDELELPAYRPSVLHASPADFRVASAGTGDVLVPAIEIMDRTVTRRIDLHLPVKDGVVSCAGEEGRVMKMAMPHPEGGFSIGFLVGVGGCLGAMSNSLASEPYHTLVIGTSDDDMAIAYNRMIELGGGVVTVQDGRIEAQLPLPLGGFMTKASAADVGAGIDAVNQWARNNGSNLENAFLTQHFLTYVGVPFFRMTPWGIYDVRKHCFLPPILNQGSEEDAL
ncbi:adenine deaminase C-terminal domain-containing protein [Geobacter metallireducens]|nr:adenine deaminase C-terminal domain-containing protein [Geobacter metallireducens]